MEFVPSSILNFFPAHVQNMYMFRVQYRTEHVQSTCIHVYMYSDWKLKQRPFGS